jgi:hypothetical protein
MYILKTWLLQILRWAIWSFGIVIVLLLLLIQSTYWYYLSELPEDRTPSVSEYNEIITDALWVAANGRSEVYMESISPIGFVVRLLFHDSFDNLTLNLAAANARILLARDHDKKVRRGWMMSYIVASLWISQHWTAKEALNTWLDNGYYAHHYIGIVAAAKGYFDKTPQQLTSHEAFLLVSLLHAPSRFEPYCHSAQLLERTNYLIKQASLNWEKYAHLTPLDALPSILQDKAANVVCR